MRKLNLLILVLISSFTAIGAPMANGGIGLLPWKEPFPIQ